VTIIKLAGSMFSPLTISQKNTHLKLDMAFKQVEAEYASRNILPYI
jgi:hypothetical protein